MPTPGKDETKEDFIERCIPILVSEGKEQDQAVAICHSLWREKEDKGMEQDTLVYLGGEVKALGDGRVGGYLVRFTNPDDVDLEGEYFDASTDYGPAKESATYYNHGMDAKLGRRTLGSGPLKSDDVGVWVEAQLQLRDEYEKAVYQLAKAGKLGWSSGTAAHLVEREQKGEAVHITRWPLGLDASLTPTPAEPRNMAMPLKVWAESVKGLEVVPEVESFEDSTVTTTAPEGITVHVTVNQQMPGEKATMEVRDMSENKETTPVEEAPAVDVEAIVKAAVEATATKTAEAVSKAWQERMAQGQPTNADPGVHVTGSRADRAAEGNPFKGFGEFLLAVAAGHDERLPALRSQVPGLEGQYFDVTKAMGQRYVGSMTQAAMKSRKAPTGLSENVPSAGGFLVDTDRAGGLMARVYDVGRLLRMVDMSGVSAGSNGMTFNAEDETSRATGSRRGGIRFYWAGEAAEKTASQPKFRQMELKLRKAIGLCYATDELLTDAGALESWILQAFPEELSFGVEDAIIRGSGAGQPLGVLNCGALVSVAKETGQAATTIVSENINKMWARRWLGGRGYVWLINQDCMPELENMSYAVGTGGVPVYVPPGGLADAPYGRLKGAPVLETEYSCTLGTVGDILLVSLSEYKMIEKGGVEAASSIHVRFVYDETCFRFVYRCDGQPKWNQPLTPYQGTNTVSPFVALASRA